MQEINLEFRIMGHTTEGVNQKLCYNNAEGRDTRNVFWRWYNLRNKRIKD